MRFDCLRGVPLRRTTHLPILFILLSACLVAQGLAFQDAPDPPIEAAPIEAAAARPSAEVVKLTLPITPTVKSAFLNALTRYVSQLPADGAPATLVIEFAAKNPGDVRGSNFFESVQIAEFLTDAAMTRVRTVAYLPNDVQGHAVLVALACESIIMTPTAQLGDAGIDDTPAELKNRADEYLQIARARQKIAPALALAMLDKSVQAYRVETDAGTIYATANELIELKKTKNILKETPVEPRPLLLNGREARSAFGIADYLADDRAGVEQALGVKLRENPSRFGDWKAILIRIDGTLSPSMLAERLKILEKAYNDGEANFALIEIDSDGGAPDDALGFAEYLMTRDPGRMRTVAWISEKALGDAAWIALGCDDLVMKPGALLGGEGAAVVPDEVTGPLVVKFKNAMQAAKKRNWSLGAAVIGAKKPVWIYKNTQSGRTAILGEDELREQPDPAAWKQGEKLVDADARLSFDGRRGLELGVVEFTPENLEQLKEHYGLTGDPALKDPTWVDFFLGALRNALRTNEVVFLLFLIGGAGVIAELQTPGVGLGGMIAFICFLLFFWGKFLDGTSGWLEVLLFSFGLIFLLIELFVLPGFGIFGFGGGLMMIAALVLASQTFIIPQNSYQLIQLRNTLLTLALSGAGIIGAAIAFKRFLPSAPGFNRMLLQPPTGSELERIARREALTDFSDLLGREGKTATKLMPSGKALIDDRLIDVVAPGDFVESGVDVKVIEVRGNRVVVRRIG